MTEEASVRFGNTDIGYTVIRSRRRKKTIEITLDPERGVVVSSPLAASAHDIAQVIQRRAPWIIQRLAERRLEFRSRQFITGESVPYVGHEVRLDIEQSASKTVRLRFRPWTLRLSVPEGLTDEQRRQLVRRKLELWYRARAKERLAVALERWSAVLGVKAAGFLVRDQRKRWGSCSPSGVLRFNWRIVMAEPSLLDYVVVHELCHLRHRNHSQDFWKEVARVLPDHKLRRARLREVGDQLAL